MSLDFLRRQVSFLVLLLLLLMVMMIVHDLVLLVELLRLGLKLGHNLRLMLSLLLQNRLLLKHHVLWDLLLGARFPALRWIFNQRRIV